VINLIKSFELVSSEREFSFEFDFYLDQQEMFQFVAKFRNNWDNWNEGQGKVKKLSFPEADQCRKLDVLVVDNDLSKEGLYNMVLHTLGLIKKGGGEDEK
jgi:hypothetical protein